MFVVLTMQKAHKEIAKEQRKYSCNTETERESARDNTQDMQQYDRKNFLELNHQGPLWPPWQRAASLRAAQ